MQNIQRETSPRTSLVVYLRRNHFRNVSGDLEEQPESFSINKNILTVTIAPKIYVAAVTCQTFGEYKSFTHLNMST